MKVLAKPQADGFTSPACNFFYMNSFFIPLSVFNYSKNLKTKNLYFNKLGLCLVLLMFIRGKVYVNFVCNL